MSKTKKQSRHAVYCATVREARAAARQAVRLLWDSDWKSRLAREEYAGGDLAEAMQLEGEAGDAQEQAVEIFLDQENQNGRLGRIRRMEFILERERLQRGF